MKTRGLLAAILSCLVASAALAQQASQGQPASGAPAASNRTDLYMVHFVKAAPGKLADVLNSLKNPAAGTPMPTHVLVLRHADGDDWDFAAIQHLGPKATIDASSPIGTPEREMREWHTDTYAQGPSWAEFSRAMGIGQPQAGAAAAGKDVYVVSDYRGAAGHRAKLEDSLKKVAASSLRPADTVILQHRDGSSWDYLYVTHYNDWKDYAAQQDDPQAEARERRAGLTQEPGLELREHMAGHHDTLCTRVPVQAK
ncbi:MAG: hypothetical protein M3S32_05735 [Acidobacteriota bacterium]|nr:hypothetical protein [Acidobacteriota bacterium]